jgi:hypothetical protein
MPSTSDPEESGLTEQQPDNDVYRVVLYAPNRESLAQLLRERILDVGPLHARPDAREIEVHLFCNQEQIAQLRTDGWKLEVHENLSEIGRTRQQEVGKAERFEGGKVPPKGLGKKTRED